MTLSMQEAIRQNTEGNSEGKPLGVPTSYSWYSGVLLTGHNAPPSNFTAVSGWGQVYQDSTEPYYTNPNARVEVANSKTYVHLKSTGEWVLVQDQANNPVTGGHFVPDFVGNAATPMNITRAADGTVAFGAPTASYNDHFWSVSRGTYRAGDVDGVYTQMDMRVNDPKLNLVANAGADWWRDASAPYVDGFSNNPGAGMSNWVDLTTEWKTLAFYSAPALFKADPPPPLVGSPGGSPGDNIAPDAPRIVSFSPDTGTVGDGVTDSNRLTLSGTAEAGSVVTLFDGTNKIGTATANATGQWSYATAELSKAIHQFTATATDRAGNTGAASTRLNVTVSGTSGPTTPTTPPTGANLLVNGSFEAVGGAQWMSIGGGQATIAPSLPGWTALSGSKIELWNNVNGIKASNGSNFGELDYVGAKDGFYQDVRTAAGQTYNLTFDARSRPGFTGATTTIEAWWNDTLVGSIPPGGNWATYSFRVTGTGGSDRLTFREANGQEKDGLGALYDNVSLVATNSPAPTNPTGSNLLVNGSFEATSLASNQWRTFDSIAGWTAISGGTIELWNNINGVKATNGSNYGELDFLGARDGFYQTVGTESGRTYALSFDARLRPNTSAATSTIEVLWNDKVVASVPPGADWKAYNFTVTGTGGNDRLTFREAQNEGGDGLGALYDNVSLVAVGSSGVTATSSAMQTDRAIDLMTQYSASTVTGSNSSSASVFDQARTADSLAPTLTNTHQLA
jgi:hypothetical protein